MKRVLIVGSGGREHALVWKVRQSPQVGRVYVAPGNGGTATVAENVDIPETNLDALLRFVGEQHIDLTVVGPELPLSLGLADRLSAAGYRVFGPSQAAARLETSKVFAKDFMSRHGIPTAAYRVASDFAEARHCLHDLGLPVVVKADGLAAGKGVTVCHTTEEAEKALHEALVESRFGEAGRSVVLEAGLAGEEVSVLAFCDGVRVMPMLVAQDYKRAYDGDRGPNTGGMGSYAPAPALDGTVLDRVVQTVLQRAADGLCSEGFPYRGVQTVLQRAADGLCSEGFPYRGVLYAGLMLTDDGPMVLEFNARFGDPETQAILPLLDGDLFDILGNCADGHLEPSTVRWHAGACVCVVCAAPGYPGPYPKGMTISGLAEAEAEEGITVFHAGTRRQDRSLLTTGGRVLGVTCRARDIPSAVEGAYRAVSHVHFEGMHYRRDIAARALQRSYGQADRER